MNPSSSHALVMAVAVLVAPLPFHHLSQSYASPRILPAKRTHIKIDDDPETPDKDESETLDLSATAFLFGREDVDDSNKRDAVFWQVEDDLSKCKAKRCNEDRSKLPYVLSFVLGVAVATVVVAVAR